MSESDAGVERDHYIRTPAPWLAGCSDRGLRHPTNQDALSIAIGTDPGRSALIAVSDGVTTARGSEVASLVAVETAVAHLAADLHGPLPPEAALGNAFAEANRAVLASADPPSACTLIAAMVSGSTITVGNVGDSRAYWFSDGGASRLLSTDDSMAQARILLGMPREDAERSPQAHAITKWLGRQATDVTPSVVALEVNEPGWLIVCSDGLWNSASSPDQLGAVMAQCPTETPAALAQALVDWALGKGGRDNITVVAARIEP